MPSLTRWVKAQRFRAPANALASPANQRAGKGSPSRYVNRRAWESRLGFVRCPRQTGFLTVAEIAAELKMNQQTIRNWI